MHFLDILQKKRDGGTLTQEELHAVISGCVMGTIPDYQLSAFLMAVFYQGMTDEETALFALEMAHSGDMMNLSALGDLTVDKHSTGGVGDKTTLIVAPLTAALGCKVAKMSGRGLGSTGGTIDKLEAIPGYRTSLSPREFLLQVEKIGIAVTGQTGNLAPADKKLYALRDVTATVDSIPLIASSVMSKKIAAGASSIVLDVKVGAGAFMKTPADARLLAQQMVQIGRRCGKHVTALLTAMDIPLGYAVGNALEVAEAVEVLNGGGPAPLRQLCIALSAYLVKAARGWDLDTCVTRVTQTLDSGEALDKFFKWISAQGGDVDFLQTALPHTEYTMEINSPRSGYLYGINAGNIGEAAVLLGAGRFKKEDRIDPMAGIKIMKNIGDRLQTGDLIAVLYADSPISKEAVQKVQSALEIRKTAPHKQPLILDVIEE